jgi:UDP:flavonoid glycosyltransferase YjiC (YdhE family)
VALGKGLYNIGHTVRILASLDFKNLVTDHGLEFFEMRDNMKSDSQSSRDLLEKGNFINILSHIGPAA